MNDDRGLVKACLAGDATAVRTFVERFQPSVLGLCVRMLGDRHEAEDATQDSLVRAFRALDRWDAVRPLEPWLLAIAANRCRTRLGKRSRGPQLSDDFSQVAARPTRDETLSSDFAGELERGLAEIRPDQRRCFTLYYLEERPIQEIATILDCPEGTVKIWLYRTRKHLADWLQRRGWTEES